METRNSKGQFINGDNPLSIPHRFTAEKSRGNQHAKGNPPNKTSFDGSINQDKHPSWKGGIQHTRDGYYICYAPCKRMPLARYRYIELYGEIPKGYVIYHINGDKFDDNYNNLEAISRSELIRRNAKHY